MFSISYVWNGLTFGHNGLVSSLLIYIDVTVIVHDLRSTGGNTLDLPFLPGPNWFLVVFREMIRNRVVPLD